MLSSKQNIFLSAAVILSMACFFLFVLTQCVECNSIFSSKPVEDSQAADRDRIRDILSFLSIEDERVYVEESFYVHKSAFVSWEICKIPVYDEACDAFEGESIPLPADWRDQVSANWQSVDWWDNNQVLSGQLIRYKVRGSMDAFAVYVRDDETADCWVYIILISE